MKFTIRDVMQFILLSAILAAGCTSAVNDGPGVTVKVGPASPSGHNDHAVAEEERSRVLTLINEPGGNQADKALAAKWLKKCQQDFRDGLQAGNFEAAASAYRKQLEGKSLAELAAEQKALEDK